MSSRTKEVVEQAVFAEIGVGLLYMFAAGRFRRAKALLLLVDLRLEFAHYTAKEGA